MQLNGQIDSRLKELEDINKEIQVFRETSQNEEITTQQNYYELLAKKIDKSRLLFQTLSLRQQQQAFNEIATNQFRT
jgi:hypothetical protein